jgi:hydroxysqualene dehydroxylase
VSAARVAVVGGGLAGIAAALQAADRGADVVLFERRARLGGLTWSFDRKGRSFDNGQHVFLRCCTEYRRFLDRIGAAGQVTMQRHLDVPVLSPGGPTAHIARSRLGLPSPLHLAASLLRYRHLPVIDRLRLGRAVRAMRALTLDDPALDRETFGGWLERHGQSQAAIERLWDLVVLPTVNVGAGDASLALAAKVFRTGLLDSVDGADVGWASVPLSELHGRNGARALEAAGVEVSCSSAVDAVTTGGGGVTVTTGTRREGVDAAIVALSHDAAPAVLPDGALGDVGGLGHSPIVNVHLVLDRKVTDLPFAAAVGSPVQYVFDHTAASGIERARTGAAQCLVVSLSAATAFVGGRPDDLIRRFHGALGDLFPAAGRAGLVDGVVSREHTATFRGVPGTAALRPGAVTAVPGVFLAGAWCDTRWPATMEGAVRSGAAAAVATLASLGQLPPASPEAGRPLQETPA